MLNTAYGYEGAFVAPHRAAALAGRDILRAGGSAIEAMVAAAATIAVIYPHMNSIGGDGFWLIQHKGQKPIGISACGPSAQLATPEFYASHGFNHDLPPRGALAAMTVPGAISGWQAALALLPQIAPEHKPIPLHDLLANAISHARNGFAISQNQAQYCADKIDSLKDVPGFADIFLEQKAAPPAGTKLIQSALAQTLDILRRDGLESYYRGDIAKTHGRFLKEAGSPLRGNDLAAFKAEIVAPLNVAHSKGQLYNMTPPSQGVASLMILALYDRLNISPGQPSFEHSHFKHMRFEEMHGLIEATKQAFLIRNAGLGDPRAMAEPAANWLEDAFLDTLAHKIDMQRALPWPYPPAHGDTVWMGAADKNGTVISYLQSVYWEFGSALTCPDTGVFFQNRGAGFSLAPPAEAPGPNQLAPGKRPFHTLNPALARLQDGRIMAYGAMGGEGQPQTQSALFTRIVDLNMGLQRAITAPRWLLGRSWGQSSNSLKLEEGFDPDLIEALRAAGHDVEMIPAYSDLVGHAGGIITHPNGLMEAACDPRSDGAALAE